ncbi:MAG: dihydrolipoyl dehydrogenase [Mycobacterium sp.]
MNQRSADVVVLGGGSGGYACALRAAQLGQSVLLIEQRELGGTCLHRGCIPTKAFLHTAEIADSVRDGNTFGVRSSLAGIDMSGVLAYKGGVVDKLYKGLRGLVRSRGIAVVTGTGTLVAPDAIEVDGTRISGRNLVLATGSSPNTMPDVPLSARVVTSEQALEISHVPERIIVLGGGVIGVEFASLWRSFGASVTIVEALPRLVPSEDPFLSSGLERALRRRGIVVHTNVRVNDVKDVEDVEDVEDVAAHDGHGHVVVTLDSGDEMTADLLLVAVGRRPNTSGMGFDQAGIRLDGGHVVVNSELRTSVCNVYAVGDIVAGPQLAHRGFQQGIFVAEHIAGMGPRRVDDSAIPRVTYCSPEIASVGLTEEAARKEYGDIETVTYDLAGNGKSQLLRTQGAVKLVKAGGRGTPGAVVGVHMIGARVGEMIGEAQLICGWEAHADDVTPFIHAHPTQTEALGEAHLALAGKALHAHA